MAIRSVQQYNQFRRGGSASSQSSYALTLVKKTNAATDDYIDNQYKIGAITAEDYLSRLNERLQLRSYFTPLQRENLNQKIVEVTDSYNDSQVEAAYKVGQVDSAYVRDYYAKKLEKLTPGNEAYNQLTAKVTGLTDKAQREGRTNFRIQENLRISQMPEDTSEQMHQKAQLYERLEQQARLDGDNQQADVYATSKNNYRSSASKADINDRITGVRFENSQTNDVLRGQPSADEGAQIYQQATGQRFPGFTGTSVDVTPTPTKEAEIKAMQKNIDMTSRQLKDAEKRGDKKTASALKNKLIELSGGQVKPEVQKPDFASIVSQDPVIRNKLEGLSNTKKTINIQLGRKADLENYINELQSLVPRATGDQKTLLQTRLNEAKNDLAVLNDSIDSKSSEINEKILDVQETYRTKIKSEVGRYASSDSTNYKRIKTQLNNQLSAGKIDKQIYARELSNLVAARDVFLKDAIDIHKEIGDDEGVDKYFTEYDSFEQGDLITAKDIAKNIDKYERLADGKGKVKLQNVGEAKKQGKFFSEYVGRNGVFYPVKYPGTDSSTGLPVDAARQKEEGRINKTGYIEVGGKKVPVLSVVYKDYSEDPKGKKYIRNITADQVNPKDPYSPFKFNNSTKMYEFAPKTGKVGFANPFEMPSVENLKRNTGAVVNSVKSVAQGIANIVSGRKDQQKQTQAQPKGFFETAKNLIFPPVYASDQNINKLSKQTINTKQDVTGNFVTGTPQQYKTIIAEASKKYGVPTDLLSALLKAESNFNPEARSGVGAQGIAQFMPATARELGVNPNDPNSAIQGAARYLSQHYKTFGRWDEALAAYNAGAGAVEEAGGIPNYPETQNYVTKIFNYAKQAVPEARPKQIIPQVEASSGQPQQQQQKPGIISNIATGISNIFRPQSSQSSQPSKPSTPNVAKLVSNIKVTPQSQAAVRAVQQTPVIKSLAPPKVSQPSATLKAPPPAPKPASKPSPIQNVVKTVQNVAKSVASAISNLFKRK